MLSGTERLSFLGHDVLLRKVVFSVQWFESLLVIILDAFYDTVFIFLLFTQIQSGKDNGIGLTQDTIPVVILKWSDLSSFISSTFCADI